MNSNDDPAAELELWAKAAHAAQYKIKLLALNSRMSCKQLRQYFQDRFHHTPKEFLDRLRAARAAHDLRHGASPKEVTAAYLYSDAAHLNHALKRHLHLTPTEIVGGRPAAAAAHARAFLALLAREPFIQEKGPFIQHNELGE
jgi:AraC-like DNA-binding protein